MIISSLDLYLDAALRCVFKDGVMGIEIRSGFCSMLLER